MSSCLVYVFEGHVLQSFLVPAQLVTEHIVPFEDTFSSTDLLFAEVIAGEGEDVDEDPEQGGDAHWQRPGGEKVQWKVLDPD